MHLIGSCWWSGVWNAWNLKTDEVFDILDNVFDILDKSDRNSGNLYILCLSSCRLYIKVLNNPRAGICLNATGSFK